MGVNTIVIDGNLGTDPDINMFGENKKAKFRFCNHRGKDSDGMWFTVVAWNKTADVCQEYLTKGKYIIVTGILNQRDYQAADGSNRSVIEIQATNIAFPNIAKDKNSPELKSDSPDVSGDSDDGIPF